MTKQAQPTPGPWHLEPKVAKGQWIYASEPLDYVALVCWRDENEPETAANADLINAAPAYRLVWGQLPPELREAMLAKAPGWVRTAIDNDKL